MTSAPPPTAVVRRSLPLGRRLPLLILGVLTAILVLSLGMSYYEVRHAAELSAGERLTSLTQVLASMVQTQTANRLGLMHRVAADTAVLNALRSPNRAPSPAAVKALSVLVSRADSLTPPQLWTADGRVIGSMQLDMPSDVQRFRGDIQARVPSSDSGYVGKLYVVGGHASLWQAVAVHDKGELLGYVAQERRINSNPRALQPFRDLIGSDIDFYFRNADDNTWVPLTGTPVPAPTRVRRFSDSLQILTNGSQGDALASTARIKGTPFMITLERPMSAILARPLTATRTLAVIAALLALLGAGIAWIFGRQLARPLVELTGAAEAIAHGEYSKRVAANRGGGDEIDRLGAAFNRMAEQVHVASDRSAEAVEQLTKSVATQHFLAEASRILAMSLSDEMLLTDLARHCVPTIADYCSIHVADGDGVIRRVETAHYDPAKLDTLRALVGRYQFRVDGEGQVPEVMRSQQPLIIPRLDRTAVRNTAPDEATVRLIDEIGPTSFMCLPLMARGRSFGAMSFTMTDSGRIFARGDLDLALELARRTAVAIDNAMIYRRSLALRLEAEAASSAKSDFLAKMSHEIRTPINAMMGYAELLEMGISGPVSAAQAKQLARIRVSGEHLSSLVNEILDLAKIEAGRMGIEPTNGIASHCVEAALALIRPLAVTKGVELSPAPDGDIDVEYIGDPQRVQQILTNLLSNAVKFTRPGGSVTAHCGIGERPDPSTGDHSNGDGDHVWTRIVVEDTGVGIAAEDLERVFDPFVQVEAGYTRSQGGTGLGLTISRGLAQLMGGEISVESTVGVGSRFTLWLPSPNSCITDS